MKKIPSLYLFDWEHGHKLTDKINQECEWVFRGEGTATEKVDGTAVMVDETGALFKRYDCKKGKMPPNGFLPCQDPDTITGHWPGWLPSTDIPEDKWIREAFHNSSQTVVAGTYEAVGPKINGNPHKLEKHMLYRHGSHILPAMDKPEGQEQIRTYLTENDYEGIVWHHPDGRMAKIKRRDFGLSWPLTSASERGNK